MRSRTERVLAKVIWRIAKRVTPNTMYLPDHLDPFDRVAEESGDRSDVLAVRLLANKADQLEKNRVRATMSNMHYDGDELGDWEVIVQRVNTTEE